MKLRRTIVIVGLVTGAFGVLALCTVALFMWAFHEEEVRLTLRVDPEPLQQRLRVPSELRVVRWVAVSQYYKGKPMGFLDNFGPSDFIVIYAYMELATSDWAALAQSSDALTFTAPAPVGHLVLPAPAWQVVTNSSSKISIGGTSVEKATLSKRSDISVRQAVRVGDGLLLEVRERLGSP